jgi:UDP-GlcNAc3NAcA epimerase
MKVVTVVGARPQFVKAATVSRAIANHNHNDAVPQIREVIVHTGQHHDSGMSDVFFDQMKIPTPDYQLGVAGGGHGQMTGRMLQGIEEVLIAEKPDVVMVYGDTNSTLAGALAAAKLYIPVAHVEAGLRSFNMRMPEEINRILTDRISRWLFCPTETAIQNLQNEGFGKFGEIWLGNVGDVMYDAAIFYQKIARPSLFIQEVVKRLGNHFYLSTVHRAENTDDLERLKEIFGALNEISKNTPVILPLHPRTKKKLDSVNVSISNICVLDPVGYFEMIFLLENCAGVFTDSGGLQKEAYFFQKPCVTLRNETEWIELVRSKVNFLAGAQRDKILELESSISRLSTDSFSRNLYGSGNASALIVNSIKVG